MVKRAPRRRWSDDFKRNFVTEFLNSGLSNSAFSRLHDVNANLLFRWRRDPRYNVNLSGPQFLPLEIVPAKPVASNGSSPAVGGSEAAISDQPPMRSFEICLPCGTQLRCDGDLLTEALSVLKGKI